MPAHSTSIVLAMHLLEGAPIGENTEYRAVDLMPTSSFKLSPMIGRRRIGNECMQPRTTVNRNYAGRPLSGLNVKFLQ
jgi:hypothetical protein